MKIYKTAGGIIIRNGQDCFISAETNWDLLINREDIWGQLQKEILQLPEAGDSSWLETKVLQAPIGTQEVWAAGVTYLRSKKARMEESVESGGASFYDKVYDAARPELFFKSNPAKTVAHHGKVRIRKDSSWNVPEPELTLVINAKGSIVGYTIGNDMSSRSIEGENPLYLPQAKVYDGSAAIGPCVCIMEEPLSSHTVIAMTIERNAQVVFEGSTSIGQMKRSHEELVNYLYCESSFPTGAYLMTGTSIVPDSPFTLQAGDEIKITIDGIGTLCNRVA